MNLSRLQYALVALLTVGLALVGVGVASADAKPVVGTQACTDAVNLNTDVTEARAAVEARQDDLVAAQRLGDPADIATARSNLDRANATLNLSVTNVTSRVCQVASATTEPVTPKPTTTPAPTSTVTVAPQPTSAPERVTTIVPVPTVRESTTVVHTDDDDSVATTSGSQVQTVPSGSVDTGAAW